MSDAISDIDIDAVFAPASQLYVGVLVGDKPHVTPDLFASSGGRLWCMTAAVTKKAGILAEDPRVAFMATADDHLVIGIGRTTVLDPLKPTELPELSTLADSAIGAAQFVLRNGAELAGAAVSALAGKLGRPLPPHRVLMAIEPLALAVVEGARVRSHNGWSGTGSPLTTVGPAGASSAAADVDVQDAPDNIRQMLEDGPAAVGWLSATGHPLVLPGDWAREAGTVRVPSAVFELVGAASSSAAAVTRDVWTGYGPTGKQGAMLRGEGTARRDVDGVTIDLAVERVTYWDGVETTTEKL